jgi:hypothetical protein
MGSDLQQSFDGASWKVKRAYRHIDELKSAIDALGGMEDERLSLTHLANGRSILKITDAGEIGAVIPLVIGDAIHNLRAPLDHIWMGLWKAAGKPGFGSFPFDETRKNLEDKLEKSPVVAGFPLAKEIILDHVKPYSDVDGNKILWTITKFDKLDKHNLIIPTIEVSTITDMSFSTPSIKGIYISNCSFSNVECIADVNGPLEYEKRGKLSFEITFPKDGFLPGEPVVPTLLQMAHATEEIVSLFRQSFL